MENAQKAVIMGGSVLLFVIAISLAVYLYSILMENVDGVLTYSENNDRTAEYFTTSSVDTKRIATRAEVVMSIINLYTSKDIQYDRIKVGGKTFNKGEDYSRTSDLANIASGGFDFYEIEEQLSSKTIIFTGTSN